MTATITTAQNEVRPSTQTGQPEGRSIRLLSKVTACNSELSWTSDNNSHDYDESIWANGQYQSKEWKENSYAMTPIQNKIYSVNYACSLIGPSVIGMNQTSGHPCQLSISMTYLHLGPPCKLSMTPSCSRSNHLKTSMRPYAGALGATGYLYSRCTNCNSKGDAAKLRVRDGTAEIAQSLARLRMPQDARWKDAAEETEMGFRHLSKLFSSHVSKKEG